MTSLLIAKLDVNIMEFDFGLVVVKYDSALELIPVI